MTPRFPPIALACLLLGACATPMPDAGRITPATSAPPVVHTIAERYVSVVIPAEELDSLASWTSPTGATWLIASAKATDQLIVFDAGSGERLRTVGAPGAAPGQFHRPNGLAVHGDHLFVAERDNQRIQVLSLPDFASLGSFGQDQLRAPYGLWINETAPGVLELYVTDSFMYGERYDVVPGLDELDQRVRRYRVVFDRDGQPRSQYLGSFGETRQATALHVVESIAGDATRDRLLIADERLPRGDGSDTSTLREYTLKGRFTGRSLPQDAFEAQAEGIALWSCSPGSGYWVAVDQLAPLTVFHLFERSSLEPAGSFRGAVTSHTDGVALHAATTREFPRGALFAVHDDQAVAAFDLDDIARQLGLSAECGG